MIRRLRKKGFWLIAGAMFASAAALQFAGVLHPIDNALSDARARQLAHEVPSDIVIIGIDAASIEALEEWPWPRRHHAQLVSELTKAAPRSVFLDVDFSSLSNSLDDALLESALTKPRDYPLHLPVYLQPLTGADTELTITRPRPRFAQRAELAVVNHERDADGLTRTWRNSWKFGDSWQRSVIDPARTLPEEHDVIIDYSILPSSFAYFSFVDVLSGRVPRDAIAGKRVFVGATAVELNDMLPVPLHKALPGVVVQALAAATVAVGAPRAPPNWIWLPLLALWTVLLAWSYGTHWRRNLAVLAVSFGVVVALSSFAFAQYRVWIEVATPMAASALLFVTVTLRSLDQQTWRALAYAIGMRRRDALLRSVVQSSTDSILCIDEAGIIRTANPAASRMFHCAAYELVDEPLAKFITLFAGEGASARLAALHGEVRECDSRTLSGEVFPVEISVSRVRLNTERLYTVFVRDIRERRAQQRRLQHQATHDSLTGLPNRAALLTHLDNALGAGPRPARIALLMLDLCRFKEVNDTLGHEVGDRLLCEVARRFQNTLDNNGLIARIGGDEFTVVLDDPTDAFIANTSQALTDSLRAPFDVAGISIEVGVSIGIARHPHDAGDAQTLLRHADVAMYVAKRRGAAYEYYDSAYDENTVRRLAIGGELRSAIAGNALELHFQPQVNLRTGLAESCEALVRWMHPTQGAIGPAEFIAIAESTDLIRPLTEWTLRGALAQSRAWRERGVHVRIAVNLSARVLQDMGFPARLRELLEQSAVPAASLELEITESAMMVDPARALRVIQEIDRLGVLISIDDFGTGYSSLGYLRDLPVNALKLDKSFVMGMRDNTDDRIIVESTAKMAHALKLELVAEGVESDADAQFLAAAGYDYAQGFHYSRALPADKCYAWIIAFNGTAMLHADQTMPTSRGEHWPCPGEDAAADSGIRRAAT